MFGAKHSSCLLLIGVDSEVGEGRERRGRKKRQRRKEWTEGEEKVVKEDLRERGENDGGEEK